MRRIGLLLAAITALYVITPALHTAAVPFVEAELGLERSHEAGARVAGASLAMGMLAAAGRAGQALGRRRVLMAALAALAAGSLLLALAFSGWSYLAGRIVVDVALAAAFLSCLGMIATAHLPGRLHRVTAGWLAAMSAGFLMAVNLAPFLASTTGWRSVMVMLAVLSATALLLVRHRLGETRTPTPAGASAKTRSAAPLLAAGALGVAGLQLAPLWGWAHPLVAALLVGAAASGLSLWPLHRGSLRRPAPFLPRSGWGAVLAIGLALGFTHVVLSVAVPSLTAAAGGDPGDDTLVLSAFGAGGAAGALLAGRRRVTAVTGASLGLPLAALGLGMLPTLLGNPACPVACGGAAAALVGFGLLLALTPRMSAFLASLPRTWAGTGIAILPGAILFGTAAAQALPYTSPLFVVAAPAEAQELLWIGAAVVGVIALFLGRPAVALAVAGVSALQYLTATAEIPHSVALVAALATGAAAGAAVWIRRQQTERLWRSREVESALQHAVLRPLPDRLGDLRLAGLYQAATADAGIGGDFLDAVHTPFGTRVLIGDVRGKGMEAVQTVTDLLGSFRSQAHETAGLGELAACLDRQVVRAAHARGDDELFATALLVQQSAPGAVEIINCGHVAPLAVTPSEVTEIDTPVLLPLGFGALASDEPPAATALPLDRRTTVVAHTDGLSEARNANGEFYPLAERLPHAPRFTPAALVAHLDTDVHDWTDHLTDDIAIVTLAGALCRAA